MRLRDFYLGNSAIIGLALVAWFVALALAELMSARRNGRQERTDDTRLLTNFGLGALVLALNTVVPLAKIGSSAISSSMGLGIAQRLNIPWALILVFLLLADSLAGYWVHRLMHAAPLLWRIHRVHHSDSAVDLSTSLRSHPLEMLATLPASAAAILVTGAPPGVVVASQTLIFAAAIWHHADIELPTWLDRALLLVLVTPAYHRLHHSPERRLHDGNYGDLISLWDRLFGTFNTAEGRGPVGLGGKAGRSMGLIDQICSPIYGV